MLLLSVLCTATLQAQPHRRVIRSLIQFPREFASDSWAVVTAPAHFDREAAVRFGAGIGASLLLFAYDEQIMAAVQRNRGVGVLAVTEDVGTAIEPLGLMGNTNKYYVAGWLLSEAVGQEQLADLFQELFTSHWIAGASRKIVGYPIGRMRPDQDSSAYAFRVGIGTSFPSGHASTIVQLAEVLSHHIDWTPATVVLYGAAGAHVYQRITSDKHWPSDALLGALWGYGTARIVIARREADRVDFVPIVGPEVGYGLSMTVRF